MELFLIISNALDGKVFQRNGHRKPGRPELKESDRSKVVINEQLTISRNLLIIITKRQRKVKLRELLVIGLRTKNNQARLYVL